MDERKKIKMAIISGASHAMKYKEKHPSAGSDEIIRYVSKESNEILNKLDLED